MNYLTAAAASSPLYEFSNLSSQVQSIPAVSGDISTLLPHGGSTIDLQCQIQQRDPLTLQCVPKANSIISKAGREPLIYEVPENMPLEQILQRFGIDSTTLNQKSSEINHYRSAYDPTEITLDSPTLGHRRFICREVSTFDPPINIKPPPHRRYRRRHHSETSTDDSDPTPPAIHNVLSKVWDKARTAPSPLPRSSTEPDLNRMWSGMRDYRSPIVDPRVDDAWRKMHTNIPPPIDPRVDDAWRKMHTNIPPPVDPRVNDAWRRMHNRIPPPVDPRVSGPWGRMRSSTTPMYDPRVNSAWGRMHTNVPPPVDPRVSGPWGRMRSSTPPMYDPRVNSAWGRMHTNVPPPVDPRVSGPWGRMRSSTPPMYDPRINSTWGRMHTNVPPPVDPRVSDPWGRMRSSTPPMYDPRVNSAWGRMHTNVPPPVDPRVNSAWSRMANATPSPPPIDPRYNYPNWGAVPNPTSQVPPYNANAVNQAWLNANQASQQKSNFISRMFNKMQTSSGSVINAPTVPPTMLPQPNQAVANTFAAARSVSPPMNSSNPALSNVWQHMNQPPSSPSGFLPQQPNVNQAWNQMRQTSPMPLSNAPSQFGPLGMPSNNPNRVPAPPSFAGAMSQANRQNMAFTRAV